MSPPGDEEPPSSDEDSRSDDADQVAKDGPAPNDGSGNSDATRSGAMRGAGDDEFSESTASPGAGGSKTGTGGEVVGKPSGEATGETTPQDDTETVGTQEFVYDIVSSVVAVLLVGLLLFAVSGVWPPMVAVESGSMDPHMQKGDLVFVMAEQRFPGQNAHNATGVVTARGAGDGYQKFNQQGDVIIYEPNGDDGETPIIHRAMFWVDDGENWYEKANEAHVAGADNCRELSHCPAKTAGFITKGDNNGEYDQARSGLRPVKPEWVVGTAQLKVPKLGWVRLRGGTAASGSTGLVTNGHNGNATATGNATGG